MNNGKFKKGDKIYFSTNYGEIITGIITGKIIDNKYEIKEGLTYHYQNANKINLLESYTIRRDF